MPGDAQFLPASELSAISDAVLPGVLSIGRRKGAAALTLYIRGTQTLLVPLDGVPLAEAVGLQVPDGEPKREHMAEALKALGLRWAPLNGEEADAEVSAEDTQEEEATLDELDESWLLGSDDSSGEAALRRAGTLAAAGALAHADEGRVSAAAAAGMLAGADGAQPETEAVARALHAAAQRSAGRAGAAVGAPGALVTAGKACAAALRALFDARGSEGALAVAREARTFRAETGMAAGAAAQGE
eukprot:3723392-Pleurochrysis_carterae.AAC.1